MNSLRIYLLSLLRLPLAALTILYNLYTDHATMLARARSPPGLPVPNPTAAFWQDAPPFPDLCNLQSAAGPPQTADIVIIGSGITAAAIARSVLAEWERQGEISPPLSAAAAAAAATTTTTKEQGEEKDDPSSTRRSTHTRILILEARQLCSGATGRNGGHIKASPHELFHRLTHNAHYTPQRAAALCALQTAHLAALGDVVRAEELEAVSEYRTVQTVDFAVDADTDQRQKDQMEAYLPYAPAGYEMRAYTGAEAEREFGVKAAGCVVGAVAYPAGALWPYRFVTALWDGMLRKFGAARVLGIETGTAVETVQVLDGQEDQEVEFPYEVVTNRGTIRARHVVHATNGFAAQLVPGLQGKASGVLCHMTAQQPGKDFPTDPAGKRSWSILYEHGFDYITQRPTTTTTTTTTSTSTTTTGGEILIGGGLFQSGRQGLDMFGVYDDSRTDPLTLMHLGGVLPTVFRWGDEAAGQRVLKAWSGVVGFTGDVLPLVGRLDAKLTKREVKGTVKKTEQSITDNKEKRSSSKSVAPGEWIAAYFCGDGMVWAWLCGTALGVMLAGSEDEDLPAAPGRPKGALKEWFPEELAASWERLKGMDIADLADEL